MLVKFLNPFDDKQIYFHAICAQSTLKNQPISYSLLNNDNLCYVRYDTEP